jgi:hypothetical protein
MPVSYLIIDRVILIVLQDTVSDREILEAQQALFNDPNFSGHLPRLVDATGCSTMNLSAPIIRHVAQEAYTRGLRRAALVASDSDTIYGLMRMYESYTGDALVEVFRDRVAACDWLKERKHR